ncbi:hypothetical protein WJX84_002141 [Apatococcus fuscideae]|uniref:Dynein axonemal assembly factor 11-like CS domain-containing protein n=1 Tax=Apatococcus fuscideae TaxID=2026836 RepID=A0AAW1SSC2_9CHLO
MGKITPDLIRKVTRLSFVLRLYLLDTLNRFRTARRVVTVQKAEHNEKILATLEEVALHQLSIEKIEVLGRVCRQLKILYLQNNLIQKLENLHQLKELQYLNIALNNISKFQNLQRCESLQKLDVTLNFIGKAGLLSVSSLQYNIHLKDLHCLGNPCTEWTGYRAYVIAQLPSLQNLDGTAIKPSERIAAQQALPQLAQQLHQELLADGIDPQAHSRAEDDSLDIENVQENGVVGEDGQLRRPWCAATRILEHREAQQQEADAVAKRCGSGQRDPMAAAPRPKHDNFPPLPADGSILQCNEGHWQFSLQDSDDGSHVVLEVAVGKLLDSSLIAADVQPLAVRLLIKGRLLQLKLPEEVRPDQSVAQRSKASGNLSISMPKERPPARSSPWASRGSAPGLSNFCAPQKPGLAVSQTALLHHAAVAEAQEDDDVPPL